MELKKLCSEKSIEIFGALDIKTKPDSFNDAVERIGNEWNVIRNQDCSSRDSIWLGWITGKWSGNILRVHEQYIHAQITYIGGYTFDLTVVYGENSPVKRRALWAGINEIRPSSNTNDWLLVGDFNEIRHSAEREGRGTFDRMGADDFEAAIAGFTELEAVEGNFTWSNGVSPLHTRSRLDRALGSAGWIAH